MSNKAPLRQLLVATDFSSAAERAEEHAADLARRHGAKLLLVHVAAGPDTAPGAQQLEERVGRLRSLGLEVEGICRSGSPARVILEEADLGNVDLILVGTHGRSGWRRFLLGSTTRRVIEHASCPVLALHQGDAVPAAGPRLFLIATDFSLASRWAARRAAEIFPPAPADSTVLCHAAYLSPAVVPAIAPFSVPELEKILVEDTKRILEEEREVMAAAGILCTTSLIEGYPADTLVAHAQAIGAALIVAGSVGRTGLAHLLIGSAAERIASIAHCPVLVVPPERPAADPLPAAAGE